MIGMMYTLRKFVLALAAATLALPISAQAQACKKEDFAAAVDQAGASLRKFNLDNQPKLNAKLEALRAKKGWKKTDSEDKAIEYLQDGRIGELDAQSNELLTKIDALGRTEEGKAPDCAKLAELKAAGVELLAVMKAKSSYTLEKIDIELQGATAAKETAQPTTPAEAKPGDVKIISKPAETKPEPPKVSETKPADTKPVEPKRAEVKRDAPKEATDKTAGPPVKPLTPKETAEARADAARRDVAGPREPSSSSWQTSSEQAMNVDPARPPGDAYGPPGQPYGPPSADIMTDESQGYSIDEIRDATRGFFGTISTNLASVIEYAFQKSGRPTAYILGQEGGGAFLAGLRYGNGTLYRRSSGETTKVYWHGPSVGYDVGAEGSRTLILIYKLHDPSDLYRAFTGVDGSAYVVGGVGLTLLKGGPVVMAPIRSGIGLRLGANLGYIRFTPHQTWNPF